MTPVQFGIRLTAIATVLMMSAPILAQNEVWLGGFSTAGLDGLRAVTLGPGGITTVNVSVPGNLAIWDGDSWNYEGGAGSSQSLAGGALVAAVGDEICVAGDGTTAVNLECWDGNEWYEPGGPGNGPTARVTAMAALGSNLYVAGHFTHVYLATGNPLLVSFLAVWDGAAWSGVGGGVGGPVADMTLLGGSIFVIGEFDTAGVNGLDPISVNGVAAWRDSAWDDLEQGPVEFPDPQSENRISTSPGHPDRVYALVRSFDPSTANVTPMIAEWQEGVEEWSLIAAFEPGTAVYDVFAAPNGSLYGHGDFSSFGDPAMDGIARWTGSTWEPLPNIATVPDLSGFTILDWAGDETNLFLAHQATYNGEEVYSQGFLGFDGSEWWSYGEGVGRRDPAGMYNDEVRALEEFHGDLFAGGVFTVAGDRVIETVARFDGTEWSALAGGIEHPGRIDAMEEFDGDLYVAGKFAMADGQVVNHLARWNGSSWSDVAGGVPATAPGVFAALSDDQHLYIGGSFTEAAGTPAFNLARWDGADFEEVGGGVIGSAVNALTWWDGRLCAGGTFQVVNSSEFVSNLACWTGSVWENPGGGVSGQPFSTFVLAAAADDTYLYIGGQFMFAGALPVSNIARWDGANWEALGTGLDGAVRDMALIGNRLYVAGQFSNAGGVAAEGVAVWDGASWSAIGDGLEGGRGLSLFHKPSSGCLFVGGVFGEVDGLNSNNVAIIDLGDSTGSEGGAPPDTSLDRCLEGVLFSDGFESGDTSAWSSTQ